MPRATTTSSMVKMCTMKGSFYETAIERRRDLRRVHLHVGYPTADLREAYPAESAEWAHLRQRRQSLRRQRRLEPNPDLRCAARAKDLAHDQRRSEFSRASCVRLVWRSLRRQLQER